MKPNKPRLLQYLHQYLLWLGCALLLQACADVPLYVAPNKPFDTGSSKPRVSAVVNPDARLDDESIVALSFSGGGLRAASYAYGVLEGLGQLKSSGSTTLLDDVGFITSVSGGSLMAAYFGLHGKQGMPEFRNTVLARGGEDDLRMSLLNPNNIARLFAGGLNDRNTLRSWLDDRVFKQATYADLFRHGKPQVWVNATDLYHRMAFPFHELSFSSLCSDLSQLPVADAVYASMAVPLVFAPLVLQAYPDSCSSSSLAATAAPLVNTSKFSLTDPKTPLSIKAIMRSVLERREKAKDDKGKFIKLADGGLTDNFGLATLQHLRHVSGTPYGPLGRHDAVKVRRMLFVVVDAGQGTAGDWNNRSEGPSGIELASAAIDTAIEANARGSFDAFLVMMQLWQSDIIKFRCGLSPAELKALRGDTSNWRCDDVQFTVTRVAFDDFEAERAAQLGAIPTRLKLPAEQIEQLIQAGRESIARNEEVQAYQRDVTKRSAAKYP
jgi:NTE family protein